MSRRLTAAALLAGVICARPAVAAGVRPASAPARALAQGTTIERGLPAGQAHRYLVTLHAGDLLHVTIVQRGADIAAALIAPDGRELLTVDNADDLYRPETLVAIVDTGGAYTLAIRGVSTATPRLGGYSLHVDELRPAVAVDRVRVDAERAYARGRALRDRGEPKAFPQAVDDLNAALTGYRQVGDRAGQVNVLIELTWAFYALGRTDLLTTAQTAVQLARELGDRATLAAALRCVGLASERAGDMPRSLQAYEAASVISHSIGNRKAEARALNDVGQTHGRISESEQAIAYFNRALALARGAADRALETVILNNLGIAYQNVGDYRRSLDAYRRALAADQRLHRATSVILVLNNMGNLEHKLGRDREALKLHLQALELSREIGDEASEARALNTIGSTYAALGEDVKALEYHREALAMRQTLGDLLGQGASLDGEGETLHRLGRDEEARAALDEALAVRQKIRDQTGEIDTLRDIALVDRAHGDTAAALEHVSAAVDLEEALRARITSPTLRSSFVATETDKYELLIDLLEQEHASDPGAGHAAAALHASERARARTLLDSVVGARVDLRAGIAPSLLVRERTLQKELNDASTRLSRALVRSTRAAQRDAAAAKVDELTRDYQQLQVEIREQSPRYAAMMHPEPLGAAAIQHTVLDDQTVLLEFALGTDRSWLWAVTPVAIHSVELPPRRTIEPAARRLYAAFIARQRRPGESTPEYAARVAAADAVLARRSAAMSRMLFGGIARRLSGPWRAKRLAIVATGALEYLPFAALPEPEARPPIAKPLAARHEIVLLPSASVIAVLRREASARRPAPEAVAIVADPVFDRSDPRVTSGPVPAAAHHARWSAPSESAHAGPARLPFSREEADAIASMAPHAAVLEATDFRASRATVLRGALDHYRIVHFATHGIVDSNRPLLSSLVLSLVDERGTPRNGYLRLHDIYNLHLDADLVVLSACQTALGQQIKGEGLVGLTRAFMYAGTPRVVATLWEVSDVATAELMKKFYRGLLQQRLRPAAALRAAQLEMRADPRWAAPYYWAGFELQGDWK